MNAAISTFPRQNSLKINQTEECSWYHPKSDHLSWLSIAEVFINVPSQKKKLLLGGIPVFTGSIKLRFFYFEHITLNKISNKKSKELILK